MSLVMASVSGGPGALFPQDPERGKKAMWREGGFGGCLPTAVCHPTSSDSDSSQCELGEESTETHPTVRPQPGQKHHRWNTVPGAVPTRQLLFHFTEAPGDK